MPARFCTSDWSQSDRRTQKDHGRAGYVLTWKNSGCTDPQIPLDMYWLSTWYIQNGWSIPFMNTRLQKHVLCFCAQVSEAIFERISLSATGFCKYDRNRLVGLNVCIDCMWQWVSCVRAGAGTPTWTGTRWKERPFCTTHSEWAAVRWSWTASRGTTGSEPHILVSKHVTGSRSDRTFGFFHTDVEDGHRDGRR